MLAFMLLASGYIVWLLNCVYCAVRVHRRELRTGRVLQS